MARKKHLRVAFIGAGGIAGAHLNALKDFDDVSVVGLADISEKSMADKAESFGIPADACFTDYKKMLKALAPDAVNVCTPNGMHAPATIAALKAGAHVIVEKSMAMNAGECKKMIAAAAAADRKLVIGFQYRYDPKTAFLCDLRDEGVFGDIIYGRVQALRRRGIPNWGVFGRKDLQGGGPMIDIGVHALEMCHFAMGSPKPVAAVGMTQTYIGDKPSDRVASQWAGWDHKTYTVEDIAIGHIRMENGAVIHIESTFAAHHQHQGLMDFQLMGTEGGAIWSESKVFTDRHGYMMDMTPAYLPNLGGFGGYFPMKNRNFVDHVLYDKPTMAPAEHGLMVQQMLDGVYRSAEKGGKEVTIK
jgi:predicted dehydrogenase